MASIDMKSNHMEYVNTKSMNKKSTDTESTHMRSNNEMSIIQKSIENCCINCNRISVGVIARTRDVRITTRKYMRLAQCKYEGNHKGGALALNRVRSHHSAGFASQEGGGLGSQQDTRLRLNTKICLVFSIWSSTNSNLSPRSSNE